MSKEFLQEYVEEVKEHLQELENSLLTLEAEGTRREEIYQIFRAAHSIKGASAYMGFEGLAHLTHELESLISAVQAQTHTVSPEGITILLECVDFIARAVNRLQETGEEPRPPASLLKKLSALLDSETGESVARAGPANHEPLPTGDVVQHPLSPPARHLKIAAEQGDGRGLLLQSPAANEEWEPPVAGDEDEELYQIFATSFQDNFSELLGIVNKSGEKSILDDEFEKAQNLIKRLIRSSQYMDYEPLLDVLQELEASVVQCHLSGGIDRQQLGSLLISSQRHVRQVMPELLPASLVSRAETSPSVAHPETEEEDAELLAIYLDACQQQFLALTQLAESLAETALSGSDVEQARQAVRRLFSSARYMGYDELLDVFEEWQRSLMDLHQQGQLTGHLLSELISTYSQRLEKVKPALKFFPDSGVDPKGGAADELQEEDEELFNIFLESFHSQFAELTQIGGDGSDTILSADHLGQARELLRRLMAASHYMSYDHVTNTLRELEESLARAHRSGALDSHQFVEMIDGCAQRLEKAIPVLQVRQHASTTSEITETTGIEDVIDDSFDESAKPLHTEPIQPPQVQSTAHVEPVLKDVAPEPDSPDLVVTPPETKPAKKDHQSPPDDVTTAVTLRVDAQKVDQLLNQVGELVVSRSEFVQSANVFREILRDLTVQGKLSREELKRLRALNFRLNESTMSLGRIANDLQDSVMRVRMLAISQLFQRFPRVVRDQALKLGKKVELVVEGGDTEIDKRVLEQMHDPLVQFLRNAIAHGIESAAERRQAGKPESGTIRIAAYHEGDYVALEIEDDGRGVDTHKLRQILSGRREISAHELERLSDEELSNAIFLPGVSTSESVDGSAGRGVGLDVVKRNVERMNGTIKVESYPQAGTRVTIRIPLTVAIIRALLVRGGSQVFTLPLTSISEILRYQSEETNTIEGFEVITPRGKTIPLVHLTRLLNLAVDPAYNGHKSIVIVKTSFRDVGVVVDGIMGEREVVIKPIEDDFHPFDGFSGATVLGDGNVSLIVDVSALLKKTRHSLGQYSAPQPEYLH